MTKKPTTITPPAPTETAKRIYIVTNTGDDTRITRAQICAKNLILACRPSGDMQTDVAIEQLREALDDLDRPRLVRAISQSQTIRHVQPGPFEAHVASQDDLVRSISQGVKVEDAGGAE